MGRAATDELQAPCALLHGSVAVACAICLLVLRPFSSRPRGSPERELYDVNECGVVLSSLRLAIEVLLPGRDALANELRFMVG